MGVCGVGGMRERDGGGGEREEGVAGWWWWIKWERSEREKRG